MVSPKSCGTDFAYQPLPGGGQFKVTLRSPPGLVNGALNSTQLHGDLNHCSDR